MGSFVVRVLVAFAAAMLSMIVFGAGTASADVLTGQTYNDAAAKISGWKGKPVIDTVSGDQVEKGDCIVTSWRKSMFLNSSGENNRKDEFLLSLNCNNPIASPGNPGNSAMTPEGVKAKKDQTNAAAINEDPAFCEKNDATLQWCQKVCKRTGLCAI
jgi:hypothetical protein